MKRITTAARWTLPLVAVLALIGVLGARPALAAGVVGTGSPASCTEGAFNAAFAGGGNVTFNCGPNPVTITLTGYKQVVINTTIDGANKITLNAGNNYHFQVFDTRTLILKKIKLVGGLGTSGSIENLGTLKTNFVTFKKNESTQSGGAIRNFGDLNLNNTVFIKNKALDHGGAIWNESGNAKVKNSKFKGNQVTASSTGTGGAIGNEGGDVTVTLTSFTKNQAADGGAFWSQYSSTNSIKASTFTKNTAVTGAAITNYGGMELSGSVIAANIAESQGGGIFHGGSLSISKTTVRDNHAELGGGMRTFGNSLFINQSTFSGNSATTHGAGVYSTADTDVQNSTFSGNNAGAGSGGGGWYQGHNKVTFKFVTIANNTAYYGSGVYADSSSTAPPPFIELQNSVLSNNVGGNCGGGTITSLGYNVSSDTYCGDFTQTGDKTNKNANLGPLANNGGPTWTHLPIAPSPLINKGLNDASIPVDQRGLPRPVGPKSDIGAVEVQ